jgi:2-polyprenyl-3-methyl-5-hydroxy-6-metoxy-1,4-benzoquinol methylase
MHLTVHSYRLQCGYLFAIDPYWLDEAYTSAIASTDTGLVKRNISISAKLACLLYFGMQERGKGRYVDFAGGYGMLTRIMRDYGFDFHWQDKYCTNLLAQGFEYIKDTSNYDAVTAFEVLEHVTNPVEFINNTLLEINTDTIIFSTLLYDGAPPKPNEWWYYAFQSGQHIGFFQKKTLEIIGKKLNLNFYSVNKIHILSRKKFKPKLLTISTDELISRLASYFVQFKTGSKTQDDQNIISAKLNELNLRA